MERDLIAEFLGRGGVIEQVPAQQVKADRTVGSRKALNGRVKSPNKAKRGGQRHVLNV